MVSSTGARLLVAALVVALGQVLLCAVPTFVGGAPSSSHQLRLASGRQHELQGHKVTAHFFKKLLNRKKKANVAETVPDVSEAAAAEVAETPAPEVAETAVAEVAATVPDILAAASAVSSRAAASSAVAEVAAASAASAAALEKDEPAPSETISTISTPHAQVAEKPVKTHEEQTEPFLNVMTDDENPVRGQVAAQKDPVKKVGLDDLIFRMMDAAPTTSSLAKKADMQDDLMKFFMELQANIEKLFKNGKE